MTALAFTYWKQHPAWPRDGGFDERGNWTVNPEGYFFSRMFYRAPLPDPPDFLPTPGRTFSTTTPVFEWFGVGADFPGVVYKWSQFAYPKSQFYVIGTRASDGKEVCVAEAFSVGRTPAGGFAFKGSWELERDRLGNTWANDRVGRLWRPSFEPFMYPEEPVNRWMPVDPEHAGPPFFMVQVANLIWTTNISDPEWSYETGGPPSQPIDGSGNFAILGVDTDAPPAAAAFAAPSRFGFVERPQS